MVNSLLTGLNDKQKEAVITTEGYVRVIASAGSGKTKALTIRYAYLVECLGISPSNILCVTFTNKAAQELRKRIRSLVSPGNTNDFISTYHGFCIKVLREEINKLSYPKSFIVMDTEDQKSILSEIYDEMNITYRDVSFKDIIGYISFTKGLTDRPNYIKKYIESFEYIEIDAEYSLNERIFINYVKKQKKNYALDFDDLIHFTFHIFVEFPEILHKWQTRLSYIMVDETQDNSRVQWDLVEMISNKYKNLCVVGDPDQSIYGWRGASPEELVNFDKRFRPCTTIIMDENYRSTPDVLNVANCIIKNNKERIEKDMFTKKTNGQKVTHFHGKTEFEEGLWVAQTIIKHQAYDAALKDFAILYRANHVSRYIEQALIKNGIPYVIFGGIRFFERKEIKDAISYLRLINSDDDFSFLRVINSPKRKLGKVFLNRLKEKSEQNNLSLYETLKNNINSNEFNKEGAKFFIKLIEECRKNKDGLSISDLMQYVFDESGLEKELRLDGEQERLENITELMSSIILYEKENINEEISNLDGYLQDIALYTNLDYKEDTEFVKLMTIHQSKGLEFKYVFVCGMSEGIMPSYRALRERKIKALEEERRLAYVAITRAEEELFLTESEGFNYELNQFKYPSRFIFEVKDDYFVVDGILSEELKTESLQSIRNLDTDLFSNDDGKYFHSIILQVNEKVKHPVFGVGNIINVDNKEVSYWIKFENFELPKPVSFRFLGLVRMNQ